MKDKIKTINDSIVTMSEMVMPNDTNNLNTLFGGKLMNWMDVAAAICAHKHCNKTVVTASVDNISFKAPIQKGDIVKQGDVIGTVGSSGRSTGPHLDVRLNWFGTRLDPATVLNIK